MSSERGGEAGEAGWLGAGVADDAVAAVDGEALVVDVTGFSGPLELLLALARTQKVDLAAISVVALVDQYLNFIGEARRLRLEVAADYLVMAAWLAFLKSRLLLPRETDAVEVESAEEMARRFAFRLRRLDAMRSAAATLMARQRLGLAVFPRGAPEPVTVLRSRRYSAELFDLLKAYGAQRRRTVKVVHVVKARKVWSIKDARRRLERLIGESVVGWMQLDEFLSLYAPKPEDRRSVLASSFGASLELAREGQIDLRQETIFAPIFMKKRDRSATGSDPG